MERNEAMKLFLSKYNTGRSCKNGHKSDRYTTSGACSSCIGDNSKNFNYARKLKLAELDVNTSNIFVNLDKDSMWNAKVILDSYDCGFHPDFVNPYPFKEVRELAAGVYRVPVRVPHNKVEHFMRIARTLTALSLGHLQKPNYPNKGE